MARASNGLKAKPGACLAVASPSTALASDEQRVWRSLSNRLRRAYFINAAGHPFTVIFLAVSIVTVLIASSMFIALLTLCAEVAGVTVVSRTRWFRRRLDERLQTAALEAASRARDLRVARLNAAHRSEVAKLQSLVEKTRALSGTPGADSSADAMEELVDAYIELASSHESASGSLIVGLDKLPEATLRALSHKALEGPHELREHCARRLEVAKKRVQARAAIELWIERLVHQMAGIAELAYLLYERTVRRADSTLFGEEEMEELLRIYGHVDLAGPVELTVEAANDVAPAEGALSGAR